MKLALVLALLTGCASGPGIGSPCACTDAVAPLAAADVAAEQLAARDEVRARFPGAACAWDRLPPVEFRACFFRVDQPKLPSGNDCYAGVTLADRVVVATQDGPVRTAALIRWETRNFYYVCAGHKELAQ